MRQMTREQQTTFASAIREGFIDADRPQWHSFAGTWVRKHPKRVSMLSRLREIIGHNPEWEDLTDDTLSDLKDTMLMEMSPNSVKTICAELKAVLNRNKATKPIASDSFSSILRSKKVPAQSVYLTPGELDKIHRYEPYSRREAYVKEMFLRECLTGARSIDSQNLSLSNIHEENGIEFITYVPVKHPVEVTVPVHKWLKNYLHEDWEDELRNIRPDKLNEPIKRICKDCGINQQVTVYKAGRAMTGAKWQFVTTHVGRHTFATLLFLKGVDIVDISNMMGHVSGGQPNITMTFSYICARKQYSNKAINAFR